MRHDGLAYSGGFQYVEFVKSVDWFRYTHMPDVRELEFLESVLEMPKILGAGHHIHISTESHTLTC